MNSRRRYHQITAIIIGALMLMPLAGCEGPTKLPVTPNVLRDGSGSQLLAQLPPDQHVVEMPIIYLTDRAREEGSQKTLIKYGTKRSMYMSFGQATVSLDPTPSWDELVKASGSASDGKRYQLTVPRIEEMGNFNFSPASFEVFEGNLRFRQEVTETMAREIGKVTDLVRSRLASASRKDVYIYVHGVDNTFEDAISRAAVMWHYIGRQGVFLAYAWPAGHGGAMGYFYDRESGEFGIYHLKRLITELAKLPEVERIHLIAHSRGCDVVTTALREINLECRVRGVSTQKTLKLETLVLAAADLDMQVFAMRLELENLAAITRRLVIYSSSKDEAVGLADWLFSSHARLGTLSKSDLTVPGQELMAQIPNLQCIQCSVSGFGTSHDYMFTNPGALSDLILVLRDRKDPGEVHGRPLTPLGGAFWKLDNNYALPAEKKAEH